jgi:hypothetical protein
LRKKSFVTSAVGRSGARLGAGHRVLEPDDRLARDVSHHFRILVSLRRLEFQVLPQEPDPQSHPGSTGTSRCKCYKSFFPLSLTNRLDKVEGFPSETFSSWVLEFEGKARANPTGEPFKCFLPGQAPGVTAKC